MLTRRRNSRPRTASTTETHEDVVTSAAVEHDDGPVQRPERPAPPIDVLQLDVLLKGNITQPVTLDDIAQIRDAVLNLWPGCSVEAYTTDHKTVLVVAWWGSYGEGAIVRRAYRAV